MLEGLIPSIGTVGDALDNGLCETKPSDYEAAGHAPAASTSISAAR